MDNDLQEKILRILRISPSGLQMEEIASKLGLTRHTVAKYLEILRAEGKIHFKKIGRSKLWKEISTTTNIRILRMDDLEDPYPGGFQLLPSYAQQCAEQKIASSRE
jgi:predicted transcriptional regulator